MKIRHPKPQRIGFLLAAVLFFLMLDGPAASNAQEQKRVLYINIFEQQGESETGLGTLTDVEMDIDGNRVTELQFNPARIYIPMGQHKLRIVAKPRSGQGGTISIKEVRLSDSATGKEQTFNPNATETTVVFDNSSGTVQSAYNVIIILDKGASASTPEKEVAVTAASKDCKDPDWEGSRISFGPSAVSLDKYGLAQSKTELRPGTYVVSFYHPLLGTEYGEPGPAGSENESIARPKIYKVEVYRSFPKRELIGIYPADEDGSATVMLDAGLWNDNNVPNIKVYVEKICDFRYATVEFFEGQVEIATFLSGGTRPMFQGQANSGMVLFDNAIIKIGPGSSVQLKSPGRIYLIRMSVPRGTETTQMNLKTLFTAEGRKFIEASTVNTAKIEIRRVAAPSPLTPTPDPNTPREVLQDPTPVVVKTPTLKVTDQKTAYVVSYDAKTGVTTVGVEEGEVEITPVNALLKPFTLQAHQQVQVSGDDVGAITAFSASDGGNASKVLLYVGIGVVGLLALLGLFFFFRRQHRLAMRPAFYPEGANPAGWNAPPVNVAPPAAHEPSPRCRNPQCGKEAPAGKKFCASCGTPLNA